MCKIIVLTATYNHPNQLKMLYNSLVEQNNKAFTWLIVDDGSEETTKRQVDLIINEQKVKTIYIRKANGGKASAVNTGLDYKEKMQSMDYTIFLREKVRATMAGFPTKVSESVNGGVPVITTKTSDIEKYLPEGKGAFYIDISNHQNAISKLERLLRINATERQKQINACNMIESFDVNTYVDKMRAYMQIVLL